MWSGSGAPVFPQKLSGSLVCFFASHSDYHSLNALLYVPLLQSGKLRLLMNFLSSAEGLRLNACIRHEVISGLKLMSVSPKNLFASLTNLTIPSETHEQIAAVSPSCSLPVLTWSGWQLPKSLTMGSGAENRNSIKDHGSRIPKLSPDQSKAFLSASVPDFLQQ